MSSLKKILIGLTAAIVLLVSVMLFWANQSILPDDAATVSFSVRPGSGVKSAAWQINQSGVPLNTTLFSLLGAY